MAKILFALGIALISALQGRDIVHSESWITMLVLSLEIVINALVAYKISAD